MVEFKKVGEIIIDGGKWTFLRAWERNKDRDHGNGKRRKGTVGDLVLGEARMRQDRKEGAQEGERAGFGGHTTTGNCSCFDPRSLQGKSLVH